MKRSSLLSVIALVCVFLTVGSESNVTKKSQSYQEVQLSPSTDITEGQIDYTVDAEASTVLVLGDVELGIFGDYELPTSEKLAAGYLWSLKAPPDAMIQNSKLYRCTRQV